MRFTRHIPNALTCGNLVCGCIATWAAFAGHFAATTAFIFAAVLFDFMDGLAARLLHATSPIGKDLDSLADIVSFGFAPGAMLYRFLDVIAASVPDDRIPLAVSLLAVFTPLVIPVCSALRLAKFNNDPRQATSFIGLPVPAHAIFWASLLVSFVRMSHDTQVFNDLPTMWTLTLIVLAIAGSLLLVSELPMFSLKVKSLAWRGNERRYLLLLAAVVLTIVLPALTGISATILLYILMSVYDRFTAPT